MPVEPVQPAKPVPPQWIDHDKQRQFRDNNTLAADWLGSACATDDAQTALNCLARAEGYVQAMQVQQQTVVERALVDAMHQAVAACAQAVPIPQN